MSVPHEAPILVTAFGPFGGRAVNASSMALAALRETEPHLRTRILPVDLVEAPRRLHDALRRLAPRALVMLGEAGSAPRLRLESRAWNELDFTIPDIAGRQPRARPIVADGPPFLETTLPVADLLRSLAEAGHDPEPSTDPGRYLCNRLYHAALSRAAVPSIFVHLPLEHTLPTPRAAAALRHLLRELPV